MNKGRNTALFVVVIIVIIGAFLWHNRYGSWLAPLLGVNTVAVQTESGRARYACDAGKTISAIYYSGSTAPVTDTSAPPMPNGSVALTLSDGRSLSLPQTISGSGIRFANADESLVFWSKGNTAFVTEGLGNNAPQTYANCVATSNIGGQESWSVFASSSLGYSIKYPAGFTATAPYTYQTLGPGKDIMGVKFTIPVSMATGTNLSGDSYVSVEQMPNSAASCTADIFLDSQMGSSTMLTDNGVSYSVAQGSDAGAGNRYDETVYAIQGSSACTAVRYFVHSMEFGNFPAGTVTQFNKTAVIAQFDAIRRSLVLAK